MKYIISITIALLTLGLTACGGGSSSSSSSTGQLSVNVTDGPVENASAVVVAFTAIELKPASGSAFTIELDEMALINLLDYQGEDSIVLLDNHTVESGDYNWMRLIIELSESYIEVNNTVYSLDIPSGLQTGLKLNRPFTIGAGTTTDLTLDFELRKSVHLTGAGAYMLRPTVRLVDNLEVNTISGTVAEALIIDADCNNGANDDEGNAVYLFEGSDASLQDIQTNDTDALTTASVTYNNDTLAYEFTIGFVPFGDYTISFTCDAVLDLPLEDNSVDVDFSTPQNISVSDTPTPAVVLN